MKTHRLDKLRRFVVLSAALILIFLSCFSPAVFADNTVPEIDSTSAILYNLEHDRVLYEKNSSEKIYPAALTKLMTALLAFEYWDEKEHLVPDIVISDMVLSRSGGTNIGLVVGEVISYESLLHAMVIHGANDAANAIAETVCGNIDDFIEKMTKRADELGCQNTYFDNTTGIYSSLMYTTMEDMLKICRELYKHDEFMRMASKVNYSIPATNKKSKRTITNRNYVINPNIALGYYVDGAQGMAAGFTTQSGYCGASAMEHMGLTNIVIVSGASLTDNTYEHFRDIKKLLTYGRENFHEETVIYDNSVICELPVELGVNTDHVLLVTKNSVEILVSDDFDSSAISTNVKLASDHLTAPIRKGLVCGTLEIYYGGTLTSTVDIVADSDISRSLFLYALKGLNEFMHEKHVQTIINITVGILLLIIAAFIIYIIIRSVVRTILEVRSMKTEIKEYYRSLDERTAEEKRERKAKRLERGKKFQAAARKVRSAYRETQNERAQKVIAQQQRQLAARKKRTQASSGSSGRTAASNGRTVSSSSKKASSASSSSRKASSSNSSSRKASSDTSKRKK